MLELMSPEKFVTEINIRLDSTYKTTTDSYVDVEEWRHIVDKDNPYVVNNGVKSKNIAFSIHSQYDKADKAVVLYVLDNKGDRPYYIIKITPDNLYTDSFGADENLSIINEYSDYKSDLMGLTYVVQRKLMKVIRTTYVEAYFNSSIFRQDIHVTELNPVNVIVHIDHRKDYTEQVNQFSIEIVGIANLNLKSEEHAIDAVYQCNSVYSSLPTAEQIFSACKLQTLILQRLFNISRSGLQFNDLPFVEPNHLI